MTTTYAPRIGKLEPSGPSYTAAYRRGWDAAERGAEGALGRADFRNEPDAWYDGYVDSAAGRPKYTLRTVRRDVLQGLARLLDADRRELVRGYYRADELGDADRAAIFPSEPEPTHDVVIEHDADRGYPWRARCLTCDWRSWFYAAKHAADGMADAHRANPAEESPAGGWVTGPEPTPKYSAHLYAEGFAREYITADNLEEIRDELADFAQAVGHRGEAWADVYDYDPRDNRDESWGDYPFRRYVTDFRGRVTEELI